MNSPLLKLNSRDFIKGLMVAVLAAVVTTLASWVNVPGFDIATADWTELLRIGIAAGIGYLGKNLLSDKDGNVLGMRA